MVIRLQINKIAEKIGIKKRSEKILLCNTCCVSFPFNKHGTSQDKLIRPLRNLIRFGTKKKKNASENNVTITRQWQSRGLSLELIPETLNHVSLNTYDVKIKCFQQPTSVICFIRISSNENMHCMTALLPDSGQTVFHQRIFLKTLLIL